MPLLHQEPINPDTIKREKERPIAPIYPFYLSSYLDGIRVLDIGCGPGNYLRLFDQLSVGLDYSVRKTLVAQSLGLNVVRADLNESLPIPSASVQAIFCSHFIEHHESPVNLLREFNRVLEDRGILVLGVPAEHTLANLLKQHYFKGRSYHLYSFSTANLKNLALVCGFKVERFMYDPWPGKKLGQIGLLDIWMRVIQSLPNLLASTLSDGYWMIATKTEKPS